jgi:hypothetical protein
MRAINDYVDWWFVLDPVAYTVILVGKVSDGLDFDISDFFIV